ncbi:MAG: hypothetical protein HC838_14560 [Spirulinaceae cyanobacterium RM2_2_10]|nr:hypothetical protein [Spirulinaceae cyanobacterium RM2_2_10]
MAADSESSPREATRPLSIELFTAPNFQTKVQKTLQQARRDPDPFVETLALNHSLRQSREKVKMTAVLEVLEFRPLTLVGLAQKLDLPSEQTEQLTKNSGALARSIPLPVAPSTSSFPSWDANGDLIPLTASH